MILIINLCTIAYIWPERGMTPANTCEGGPLKRELMLQ